jgi:hypothetical protein
MDITEILGGTRREIVPKMSWTEYRKVPAMSGSVLVKGIRGDYEDGSMLALKAEWDQPGPPTPSMAWGTAVHTLSLEPSEFAKRYTLWKGRRQGNKYEDFAADAWEHGQEVLNEKEWDSVIEAAGVTINHPDVKPLIAKGQSEVAVFAAEMGMQCRGRIDRVSSPCEGYPQGLIVDLKTARGISCRTFSRQFYALHYDVKLGLYQRWYEAATGVHLPVAVVTIRNKPPFDCTTYSPVPDPVLDRGVEKAMVVFRELRACLESGVWPGVEQGILETPVWEMDDETVEFDG